jgi:thiamine pyrophosphate-dependent acetolactate synthase large subunit-like protein
MLKIFGAIEHASGVPGLDLPGLDIVATARSYGVDANEATTTDEVAELLKRASPTGTDPRSSTSPRHRSAASGGRLRS